MANPQILHTVSRNPLTVLHETLRVGKTRITLDTVVQAFNDGASPEEIVARFPSLTLGEAYAVIALYLEHRTDVDAYIALRLENSKQARDQNAKEFGLKGLRARLLSRAPENTGT